ncbi:putative transmembrane protein [Gregarina niphandrodes]|uniref:Transmembrane protein n=1 Tax=Gregarina niphandrodes TaxID=110365 RepID=A0A023BCF7_GRENI|nr:putative transmembrane protein [Gregarina niphandrodes]EZG83574.1 putative transmembrane protein [Gregarina niphandrodes]|eukprot:XP_011128935.1 putative transmembrane protein [Gregarina niphandrodes]
MSLHESLLGRSLTLPEVVADIAGGVMLVHKCSTGGSEAFVIEWEQYEEDDSDQIRSDQVRSGQIRSDQSRSDQSRSDQSRSDQSRSDQSRSDQSRSDRLKCILVMQWVNGWLGKAMCMPKLLVIKSKHHVAAVGRFVRKFWQRLNEPVSCYAPVAGFEDDIACDRMFVILRAWVFGVPVIGEYLAKLIDRSTCRCSMVSWCTSFRKDFLSYGIVWFAATILTLLIPELVAPGSVLQLLFSPSGLSTFMRALSEGSVEGLAIWRPDAVLSLFIGYICVVLTQMVLVYIVLRYSHTTRARHIAGPNEILLTISAPALVTQLVAFAHIKSCLDFCVPESEIGKNLGILSTSKNEPKLDAIYPRADAKISATKKPIDEPRIEPRIVLKMDDSVSRNNRRIQDEYVKRESRIQEFFMNCPVRKNIPDELGFYLENSGKLASLSKSVYHVPQKGIVGVHPRRETFDDSEVEDEFPGTACFLVVLAQTCEWSWLSRFLMYVLRPRLFGNKHFLHYNREQILALMGCIPPRALSPLVPKALFSPEIGHLVFFDEQLIGDTVLARVENLLSGAIYIARGLRELLLAIPPSTGGILLDRGVPKDRESARKQLSTCRRDSVRKLVEAGRPAMSGNAMSGTAMGGTAMSGTAMGGLAGRATPLANGRQTGLVLGSELRNILCLGLEQSLGNQFGNAASYQQIMVYVHADTLSSQDRLILIACLKELILHVLLVVRQAVETVQLLTLLRRQAQRHTPVRVSKFYNHLNSFQLDTREISNKLRNFKDALHQLNAVPSNPPYSVKEPLFDRYCKRHEQFLESASSNYFH